MAKEWILGLGGSDHEFSAALMSDTDIRVAIEQERLSRRKHSFALWYEEPVRAAVDYCLAAESIDLATVRSCVSSDLLPTKVRGDLAALTHRQYSHHLCHAASAYMLVPQDSTAAVVVYDGYGSAHGLRRDALRDRRETISFFMFGPDGYECIGRTMGDAYVERGDYAIAVTNSIGFFYELVTSILGYDLMDAGKTMGLAGHGSPRYREELALFFRNGESFEDAFVCDTLDRALHATLRAILSRDANSFAVRADLAATLQAIVNDTLLRCASLFGTRKVDYFCIAGGCGLNAVANSFLVEHAQVDVPVIIPPHADDAGIALGALWLHARERDGVNPRLTFRSSPLVPHLARPGRTYTIEERDAAARRAYPDVVYDSSIVSLDDLASLLIAGNVIGFFDGRSELGPRALGGRSVVADPRDVRTRERINRTIKRRESFRPLAPVILASFYDDYFDDPRLADPYMIKVARANERCRREAPAVVHADGTARVQVVSDDADTAIARLLHSFHRATGVPMLLNTSFNERGAPIVETPDDAFCAFVAMRLDGLYVDGAYYRRSEP